MKTNSDSFDFVVVGAGIVGLTIARELARRKAGRILVLEKERHVGAHASGRNSGVVHAGIYYSADSLKAQFCVRGHKLLLDYVETHQLPVLKCGKVIVATKPETVSGLDILWGRAQANGVVVKRLSLEELREIEPSAHSHGWAIWSPHTAVVDSKAVLHRLTQEIQECGVHIQYDQEVRTIDPQHRRLRTSTQTFDYGFLINAAGVYADRIAHQFGVGLHYRVLPFKGLYWKADPSFTARVRGLIYPVPDVNMPFLGIHITKTVQNEVLFGPTAIPAFGRENYSLAGGLDLIESPIIAAHLMRMLLHNSNNIRRYVREEVSRYAPARFLAEIQRLAPEVERTHVGGFYKVGIRPQLMDLRQRKLEMDFVIEDGRDSLHVLNAISPAFTCALAFAPYVTDRIQAAKPESSSRHVAPSPS
ncbi:MAG: L-2-hydroxyglutarate oxidase [Bdellovibrionales bacterium]